MKVLTLTTLYPNVKQPRHGIFVKNRLNALDKLKNFENKVIAPVPYCPLIDLISKRYKIYQNVPKHEVMDGKDVYHPKYLTVPGFNLIDNSLSIANSARNIVDQLYPENETYDLVDGQYLYPDGVAAYHLAKWHKKPLVLTARGSDVNYWMNDSKAKPMILEAIEYSSKVICVSNALKTSLINYGVAEDKIEVIINGVNPEHFNENIKAHPSDEEYFLSVGNLIPLKGHDLTLNALSKINEKNLVVVGDGEHRSYLKKIARELGIQERVQFINYLEQEKLAELYAGAKATILMSSMEGMPNVVLESLATGTPVIATNVGGISEVISEENGILLDNRSTDCLRDALVKIDEFQKPRSHIASTAKQFRWSDVSKQQITVYDQAILNFEHQF